jgi:flavin-dependent dehydrogenase
MTPVEDGYVNVCGLFPAPGVPAGKKQGEFLLAVLRGYGLEALADKIEAAKVREGSFVGAAGFALGRQRVVRGRCTLGDAEAIIPPFTGNGMSMAFESAESALDPLVGYAAGRLSWVEVCAAVEAALERRFRTRLRTARLVHPLLLRPLGQRVLVGAGRAHLVPFRLMHSLLT